MASLGSAAHRCVAVWERGPGGSGQKPTGPARTCQPGHLDVVKTTGKNWAILPGRWAVRGQGLQGTCQPPTSPLGGFFETLHLQSSWIHPRPASARETGMSETDSGQALTWAGAGRPHMQELKDRQGYCPWAWLRTPGGGPWLRPGGCVGRAHWAKAGAASASGCDEQDREEDVLGPMGGGAGRQRAGRMAPLCGAQTAPQAAADLPEMPPLLSPPDSVGAALSEPRPPRLCARPAKTSLSPGLSAGGVCLGSTSSSSDPAQPTLKCHRLSSGRWFTSLLYHMLEGTR